MAFTETAERVELAEREPLQPDEPPAAAEDWASYMVEPNESSLGDGVEGGLGDREADGSATRP